MTDEEYNRRERECIMQYDGRMTQRQAEYRAAITVRANATLYQFGESVTEIVREVKE